MILSIKNALGQNNSIHQRFKPLTNSKEDKMIIFFYQWLEVKLWVNLEMSKDW